MNAVVPITVILGHLEIDIKILNAGIETAKSDDCREMLEDNRDTNGVLATI